jgi:hypothetical protein
LNLRKNHRILLLFFIILRLQPCNGQIQDSTKKYLKNTIYVNITNPMLFGSGYNVIGYERVFKNNQSISINTGRFVLPKFINPGTNTVQLQSSYKDKGYHLSLEYRFYLKKENKYKAPRGIYIGPYYVYNYFDRSNTWTLNTTNFSGNLNTDITVNMHLVGAQIGYQFVFWNRVSLDLLFMGPGEWFFNIKTKMSTSLSEEDQAQLFEKIDSILSEKFPGYDHLIGGDEFKKHGSTTSSSLGLRYLINIGFRF